MKIFKNKYFILGNLFLILLAIPLTLFFINQQQETRSRAEATSVLSILPAAKTVNVGEEFSLDVQLDPGQNQVTNVKMRITYDPSKLEFQEITPLAPLSNTKSPEATSSSGTATVDVLFNPGSNVTAAIRGQSTKIATVKFKALEPTDPTTPVDFVRSLTELRSVSSTDAVGEDVLQTVNGAVITILTGGPTVTETLTPTPTGTSNDKAVCTDLSSTDTTGTAPLSVTLTANGNDPDQNGTITKATFNFGDGQTDEITDNLDTQSVLTQVDHTFESAGTYNVSVNFTDDQGAVGNPCTLTITVTNTDSEPTATPTTTSTQTGTTTDDGTSIASATTATPTQIQNTASPTLAPTGGIVQTIGVLGGIFLSIIAGVFLLTL